MNEQYWNERYRSGIDSGKGSVGKYRAWKWQGIDHYVDVRKSSVLDVGCGDLQFWLGRDCNNYIGIDISQVIIERARAKRPKWTFFLTDATERFPFEADVVLCMDLVFHIMTEEKLVRLLSNLKSWAQIWLFIFNWHKNPLKAVSDGKYQHFWQLEDYLRYLPPLLKRHKCDNHQSLYVFKRGE